MDFLKLAVRAASADRVAATPVQQDIGRGLEDEAGEIGDLAALAAIVQPEQNFLNQVVDFMTVSAAAEESPQGLLVRDRGMCESFRLAPGPGRFSPSHTDYPTPHFVLLLSWLLMERRRSTTSRKGVFENRAMLDFEAQLGRASAPQTCDKQTTITLADWASLPEVSRGKCRRQGAVRLFKFVRIWLLVAAALALSGPAFAAGPRPTFSIPAGLRLDRALTRFSVQSDRDILFDPKIATGRSTKGVTGAMDADLALRELLRGSGLTWRVFQGRYLIEVAPLAAAVEPPSEVEGVIVTATRRPLLDQLTPMSVRALSGDELTRAGAVTFQDAATLLPGLTQTSTGTGRNRLSVRGVYGSGEATTALYYDDVPVTGPSGTTADPGGSSPELLLVDVERLELLRGPQGTLYGASAMGGALKVVFRRPDLSRAGGTLSLEGSAISGEVGDAQSVVLNQPLVRDKVGVRLTAYRRREPAFVDNSRLDLQETNGGLVWGGRLGVGLEPTEDLQINLSATYQDAHDDDTSGGSLGSPSNISSNYVRTPFESRMKLYEGAMSWRLAGMRLSATAATYTWNSLRRIEYTGTLLAERESPDGCKRYLALAPSFACTADQQIAYSAYVDSRAPGLLNQPIELDAQVQEVRLQSEAAGFLAWTLGVFHEIRKDTIDSQVVVGSTLTGEPDFERGFTGRRIVESRLSQRAAFGEITFGADRDTSLTLGARRFEYDKITTGQALVVNVISNTSEANFSSATGEDGWSVKILGSRRLAPNVMMYAQASQGFRPGGINTVPSLPPNLAAYGADSLWNYELGLKSSWLGNRLVFNAAIYEIDWEDMQYSATSTNGAFGYITNLGKARIRGLEADTSFVLNSAWRGGVSLTLTDAVLTRDQTSAEGAGLGSAGDRIPAIPRAGAQGWMEYRRDLGGGAQLLLRGDATYVGRSHSTFDVASAIDVDLGDYWLFNVRGGVRRANWTLNAFVENLTDTDDPSFATTGRQPQVFVPRPRQFGLSATYDF
jgi:iron complex outermembrane recepter protein